MLPRRKRPALALAVAAALVLLPAVGQAQEPALDAIGNALATNLAGHRVTFPTPRWLTGPEPGEVPFVFNQIEPGVEALTFVPPGETLVAWTQILGILVVNRQGYDAKDQIASILDPIRAACTQGQLGVTPVRSQKPGQADALILACGRYKPTADGPRGCAAGFLVAVVRDSWNGAMKIYDEWCVGAFNLADRASWPVKPAELLRIAIEMQQVTAFEPLPG